MRLRRKHRTRRPAVPGEVCTCGQPAVVVFDHPALGVPMGSCLELDPQPRTGPCPFCGRLGRHDGDGICPSYTLRPAWALQPAQAALNNREPAMTGGEHR